MNEQQIIQEVKQMKPKKMKAKEDDIVRWAIDSSHVTGSQWNIAFRLQSVDHVRHVHATSMTIY